LEAANKELEAFSYTVSHDLRAPLRHIDGYVDLLLSRCRGDLNEKGRHYVDTIAASARQMGVLIDDLLQFSRTGRSEMDLAPVDMNQVLREALSQVREDCAGRSIEWQIGDLPQVRGDYALLRQVWANLLGNAVKYTRDRDPARIGVGSREGNGEVVFLVSDNGVGFDMQYAGKLFGVFQRLHRQEEFEGTGIGLATVARIVTRLGGRIWAEAEPGKGATFFFSLPQNTEVAP
jgi:light-regulated signal transduction histidine kinase (bacteriophytochrome)